MADHLVDVVNEQDEIIGQDLKNSKVAKDFISRVVGIFICDSQGKFLVCKRADHKKNAPGIWDLAAFGNVMAGEDYKTAAQRELEEELNLKCELEFLDKFYQKINFNDKDFKIFCGVFLGISDLEPELNHELVEFKKMTFEEVEEELKNNPQNFCQGFINDFNQVKNILKFKIEAFKIV